MQNTYDRFQVMTDVCRRAGPYVRPHFINKGRPHFINDGRPHFFNKGQPHFINKGKLPFIDILTIIHPSLCYVFSSDDFDS